ncbi:hypothetical protein IC3_05630 [Bacillus cereus VD142]|nr:hypothetical protein IC3_05630 [Bacillus cereus VD142]
MIVICLFYFYKERALIYLLWELSILVESSHPSFIVHPPKNKLLNTLCTNEKS